MPYAINDLTRSVFPMKVYEYLAAGLPVVTTPLPALAETPGVIIAADAPATVAALERALADDAPARAAGALAGGAAATPGTPGSTRSPRIFRTLRERLRQLARRAGYEVRQYTPLRSFAAAREALMESRGVDVVLDVGANAGQYGELLRERGYGGRLVSLEPVAEAFAELERRARADGSWEALRVAASDSDGELTLNVTGDSRSSSALPRNERFADVPGWEQRRPRSCPPAGSTAWCPSCCAPASAPT